MTNDPLLTFQTNFPRQLPAVATRAMHLCRQLQKYERMAPEQQDALVSAQLSHLLSHARRYAPFWAERIPEAATRARAPLEMLRDIPPLTRSDLQQSAARIAAQFPERAALGTIRNTTSGSTGTPVTVELARSIYLPLYHAVTLLNAKW